MRVKSGKQGARSTCCIKYGSMKWGYSNNTFNNAKQSHFERNKIVELTRKIWYMAKQVQSQIDHTNSGLVFERFPAMKLQKKHRGGRQIVLIQWDTHQADRNYVHSPLTR